MLSKIVNGKATVRAMLSNASPFLLKAIHLRLFIMNGRAIRAMFIDTSPFPHHESQGSKGNAE